MKWIATLLLGFMLMGCEPQTAIFLASGRLTGTNCPGTMYMRGGIAMKIDCVAVVITEEGPKSFPVEKEYLEFVGKNVSIIQVYEDKRVVVPIE